MTRPGGAIRVSGLVALSCVLLVNASAARAQTVDSGKAGLAEASPEDGAARDLRMTLERLLRPDWVRASILVGVVGLVGGRVAMFTFKWRHAYLTLAQGGGVATLPGASLSDKTTPIGYFFAGPEAGGVIRWGADWLSIGLQVGFGMQLRGTGCQKPWAEDEGYACFGGMVAPTVRYRHYWGGFGLEASFEWPVVFDSVQTGTPWPLLGIGGGF